MLRFTTIFNPETHAHSFAVALTDADELAIRQRAITQGLVAGDFKKIERQSGDFDFWKFQEFIKSQHK